MMFWVIEIKDSGGQYRDHEGNFCGCIAHSKKYDSKAACELAIKEHFGYNGCTKFEARQHSLIFTE